MGVEQRAVIVVNYVAGGGWRWRTTLVRIQSSVQVCGVRERDNAVA